MIRYRPFRNSDPPALAAIWRSEPPLRGLMQPMSAVVLDRRVLSKIYFDRDGLVVADKNNSPVGFVHAGFGPNEDRTNLAYERGVTCLFMAVPDVDWKQVASALLRQSEEYLLEQGAKFLYAGGMPCHTPYYFGLYGGSQVRGILESDSRRYNILRAAGYEVDQVSLILQRSLIGFRPPVDRRQMTARRNYLIEPLLDTSVGNWWEACTLGDLDRTCFRLIEKEGGDVCGQTIYWDIEPLASSWGVNAVGLLDLKINESKRRLGLATFLLSESLRSLQAQGITLAEAQISSDNEAALRLFHKLGFSEVDRVMSFVKAG